MEKKYDDEIDYSAGYRPQLQVDDYQSPAELWSEILPGLWQGGCADNNTIHGLMKGEAKPKIITKKDFDTVVTLYAFSNPCDWLVKELRYGFYDSDDMSRIDMVAIGQIVDIAYADFKAGKKVLISCQLGANRSGLVMALVLIKSGLTLDEAINLIRARRWKFALFNQTFLEFLKTHDSLSNAS